MEKYFVNYKQALALKELGFDETCLMYIDDEEDLINDDTAEWIGTPKAPLKSQVFKWFRDEHNIVHTVYSNASGYIWELHYNKERGGTHICDSEESGDCELSGMFTTYEGAESACIDKLIEIIKKK
jgi:hypothetical protein